MSRKTCIVALLGCLFLAACNGSQAASEPDASDPPVAASSTASPEAATPEPTPAATKVAPSATPAAETAQAATATPPPPQAEPAPAGSGQADADVTFVRATQTGDNTWTFSVTVTHPDTGWEDYADGWDVVLPDGTIVKPSPSDPFTRLLLHPHENEQSFTRSQSNVLIPEDVTVVTVRAHDIVDGYGGREVEVDLASASGPDFEVLR